MRKFFTRERDDSFSLASLSRAMSRGRGIEMSVTVCVGLPGHSLGDGRSVAKYRVFFSLSSLMGISYQASILQSQRSDGSA